MEKEHIRRENHIKKAEGICKKKKGTTEWGEGCNNKLIAIRLKMQ